MNRRYFDPKCEKLTAAEVKELQEKSNNFKELTNSSPNLDMTYDRWAEDMKIKKASSSTISKLAGYFSRLKSGDQYIDETLRKKLKKLHEIMEVCSQYESFLGRDVQPKHFEKSWFAYFYYNLGKEPEIGRGILSVHGSILADFKNVSDGVSVNYEGHYKHIHSDVIFFQLQLKGKNRSVHIKAYCKDLEHDKLMLGAYITYEDDHIINGTIVLEAIDSSTISPSQIKSGSFSYRDNHNSDDKIPKEIVQYLKIKKYNYNRVRKNIGNLQMLEKFIADEYEENLRRRFVDYPVPEVFIAMNTLSSDEKRTGNQLSALKMFAGNLREFYGNQIFLHDPYNPARIKLTGRGEFPSLKSLRSTSLFILIYSAMDKGSFSLLQLGWALSHCKEVLVFYERGSLSNSMMRLDSMKGVELIEASFPKDQDLITRIVNKSLERLFPGYLVKNN